MKKSFMVTVVLALVFLLSVPAVMAAGNGEPWSRNAAPGSMGIGQGTTRAFISALLKLDIAALREARSTGSSMVEIAEAQDVSADSLLQAVVDFRTEQLQQLVAEGRIAAEQAEQCLDKMTEKIKTNLERAPMPRRTEALRQRRDL
jgi:hypothetical protein